MRLSIVAISIFVAGCQQAAAPDQRIEQARAAVIAQLRDPASARFGEMTISRAGAVCGTVNGANGFGGYTGQMAFFYDPRNQEVRIASPIARERHFDARFFEERGCSIGPDHAEQLRNDRAIQEATPTGNQL